MTYLAVLLYPIARGKIFTQIMLPILKSQTNLPPSINYFVNIRTLLFICKSISNREKVSLWHVCQEMLDLHTKRQKHWTFWLHFLLGIYSAVRVRPVFITLHKMQGTRRLYTYIRHSYTFKLSLNAMITQ